MTTNVLVAFYSTYGHVHRMALAVAEGVEGVPDSTVRLRRIAELEEARKALSARDAYVRAQQPQADIPEVTHDDLRWADGIAWGTPTRYGNMSAQMKQFLDTTAELWLKGELEDKATGIFTSTASARSVDPSRHGVCRHAIRTEPAITCNRRDRWFALWTRYLSGNRRLAAAGRSRAHDRTQPRQSPCSRCGPPQGPQGESCARGIKPPNLLARADEVIERAWIWLRRCMSPQLMLWTAPPRHESAIEVGAVRTSHDSEEPEHAND
jgi:multimeric flavodoxin WrbA